jgi:hypothetical protein
MAARIKKIQLTQNWKDKIQIAAIIDRLVKHVNDECDMKPTQLKAAEILLKKVAPDLANTTIVGSDDAPVRHEHIHKFKE